MCPESDLYGRKCAGSVWVVHFLRKNKQLLQSFPRRTRSFLLSIVVVLCVMNEWTRYFGVNNVPEVSLVLNDQQRRSTRIFFKDKHTHIIMSLTHIFPKVGLLIQLQYVPNTHVNRVKQNPLTQKKCPFHLHFRKP